MWSQFLLCLLVGLAFASQDSPAWKENTEYTYDVRGRSLSGLHVSDQYTGIALRAKLVIQPQNNGRLRSKIHQPEYAEVQTSLIDGWRSDLPESQLKYQPIEMSGKPFDIVMKNGIVIELIVEQDVTQWEANMIKSFVSQIQLDTKAENLVDSEINILPSEASNNAVFKVLEDTVTGITETLYDIHPLPEYYLQSKPHLAPFPHLKGDGSIIEVVKNKNYTEGHDLPVYYYGYGDTGKWKVPSNQFSELLQRNCLSRAVITGTLQRYTVQYSESINEVIIEQSGSVNSMISLKLTNAEQQKSQFPELTSPVSLGSLVYSYGEASTNKVRQGLVFQREQYLQESNANYNDQRSNYLQKRHPRSLDRQSTEKYSESYENSIESQEDWTQPKAKLSEAPRFPLLPLSTGYKGQCIKHSPNMQIVEKVYSLTQQIGGEIQNPQEIPKKFTLARFVLLTSILRIMNEQELKQAAERLYTQETETPGYYAWTVFRDSVAQTGTGPAFLVIKYLLETRKIQEHDAASVIVTMANDARQPTEEYIREFYELVKKQMNTQQEDQHLLNETMLFAFSRLVGNVFVDDRYSHKQYPTHSFGRFNTRSGKDFVRKEYIPYLTKQLHQAVTKADSQKIHAYIRALGEVGDRDMIYAFEPYFEGKVHCSQYQRFLMVSALHKLARIEPKLVGSILYRIYQNSGETTEMRVLAVYMLMHTSPSSVMLQRMAMYTHLEQNHKVCAAVKSAIQSVSNLKGHQFAELRSAAESARPYLTKKYFGVQDSQEIFLNYVSQNWVNNFKYVLQTIVGEESGIPSSFYFAMEGHDLGFTYKHIKAESVISDIRNLFHVFVQQTQQYEQQQSKQKASQQSEQSSWASPTIARLLNLQTEELEQLEGGIFLQFDEFQKHLIFNNHTIKKLPKMLEQIMNSFENGKKVRYSKIFNSFETAVAFPTEIGLPFLYTIDTPMLLKVEGSLRANAQPKISSGDKIVIPDKIDIEGDMKMTVSGKVHTEIGIFVPFNHHHYSAGYDENVQVYIPIRSKINLDLKTKTVAFEIEPYEDKNVKLYHQSSWPYVSKHDILTLQTTAERKETHIIRRPIQNQWEYDVGKKTVGMAFRVKYENDDKYPTITDYMRQDNFFNKNLQYEQFDVEYLASQSQNKKLRMNFHYDKNDQKESLKRTSQVSRNDLLKHIAELPKDSKQRTSVLLNLAARGIENPSAHGIHASVEFSGKQNVQFKAVLAHVRNPIGSEYFVLGHVEKLTQIPGTKPWEGALSAIADMAPLSGLDMKYVMNADLKSTLEIGAAFGEKLPSNNMIEINTQFDRTESRKKYLMEQPLYHQCQKEMQQGNQQLFACANMTQTAGLLDFVKIQVKCPDSYSQHLFNILQSHFGRKLGHDFEIEQNRQPKEKQGEITVNVRYHPDLERVNVSIANNKHFAYINNIHMDECIKRIVVVHPVFNTIARLEGKLTGLETYKPICTIDKTEALTFDGSEYPLTLKPFWTVALQYVPQRSYSQAYSTVEEQLKQEIENYVVLVRQSAQGSDSKDVKIIVSSPETEGKVVDATLKPKNGNYPQVFIDGKQVDLAHPEQSQTYHNKVTVSPLANQEVLVIVEDTFQVTYDGKRAKITSLSSKLRNRIRGICGTFDGSKSDDFTTPNNCVVRDANEFIASYTVLQQGEQNQEITNLKSRTQNNHCIYKRIPLYVNYIQSAHEIRDQSRQQTRSCSKYQTRYVMENGQICFTIKPLTACEAECNQHGSIRKNVEVHCVQNTNVANLWKSQIDNGASPDFSQKSVTKVVQINVPQSCVSM